MKEETLYVEEIIKMIHKLTSKNLKKVYQIVVRYYLKQIKKWSGYSASFFSIDLFCKRL